MKIVPAGDVIALLPTRAGSMVRVCFQNSRKSAFAGTARQIQVLASRKYIVGRENRGVLVEAVLVVHAAAALRLISPMNIPGGKRAAHCKQGKGAKRWIVRLDNADTGRVASHKRVSGFAWSMPHAIAGDPANNAKRHSGHRS